MLAGRARPRAFDIRRRAAKVLVAEGFGLWVRAWLQVEGGVMKFAQLCSPSRHVIRRPADAWPPVGRLHRP